eukprot:SAG31_NODE_1993_length_6709_cov_5.744024_6_plen_311_part_00
MRFVGTYSKNGRETCSANNNHDCAGEYSSLSKFDPVILPVDARVEVDGMIPDEIAVFKSKLLPIGIPFTTPIGEDMPSKLRINPPTAEVPKRTVKVIWKTGDDLRQDSLVIQMFSVMDRILKRENIDLKLTPYIIMPTSYNDDGNGMVELVTDSKDLADVFKEYKGDPINAYLRAHHPAEDPDPKGPTFGVDKEVYETYVKSTAGYCVMTYLLAIGDRHLNNLMLRTSGHLFHIDFGFILGRDPKPLPPSMKLTTEMVTAMGKCFLLIRSSELCFLISSANLQVATKANISKSLNHTAARPSTSCASMPI